MPLPQAVGGKMERLPLYSMKEFSRNLIPSRAYKSKEWVDVLFSVPTDNAVGTNCLWNAISLLQLEKDKVVYDVVSKDFMDYVSGGILSFTPIFSEDTIGYAQTRGFLLFNLKNKNFIDHMVCTRIEEDIDDVKVVDGSRRIFLFKIDWEGKIKIFRLADLSMNKVKVLGEMKVETKSISWSVFQNTIFLMEGDIKAYNLSFKPVTHPLAEFIMANRKEFGSLEELFFHPQYPFAVLGERPSDQFKWNSWLITWTPKNEYKLLNLFTLTTAGGLQSSPDGKFIVFEGYPAHPGTYFTMKVDPNLPHYLDVPMPMGEILKNPMNVTAWTRNPLGFVVSAGDKLIRYDLESMRNVSTKQLLEVERRMK
jgi:hypothetical protein